MESIKRFSVLDAFRGLAAIFVFLFHMPNLTILTKNAFITGSAIYVDLFFILSGFVIFHNYRDRINSYSSSITFMLKRTKRLLPLHIYTLLILVILECIKFLLYNFLPFTQAPFESNTLKALWPQIFLLNSTPFFAGFYWNYPNWSISGEFICYLVFASMFLIHAKKRFSYLVLSIIIIFSGYLFFYINTGSFNIVNTLDFHFNFIRALIGFFLGIAIYYFRSYLKTISFNINLLSNSITEISICVLVVFATINLDDLITHFYIIHLAFGMLILIFSFEKGLLSTLFKKKLFQNLGSWSYSIYLNHIFIITIYNMIFLKLFKTTGLELLIFEILTGVFLCYYSYLTYRFIEKRFYSRIH